MLKWETIEKGVSSPHDTYYSRAAVPGGWIVQASGRSGIGLTFVPDESHELVIEERGIAIVKCPTCGGQKTVSKPPWVAGDQETWSSGSAGVLYPCPTCDGKGYLTIDERQSVKMKPGDKVIVSVNVYANILNVQSDGTFDVIVTEMGGSQLQPRIAVNGLKPSQLEAFV